MRSLRREFDGTHETNRERAAWVTDGARTVPAAAPAAAPRPPRGDAPLPARARDRRPSSVSRVNAKRVNPARPSPRRRDPAIRSEHYRAPRVEATKNNNYPGQLCRRVSRDVIQIHGTAYQHRSPQETSKRSPHDSTRQHTSISTIISPQHKQASPRGTKHHLILT